MSFAQYLRFGYLALQAAVVVATCWLLLPLDTRTLFAAASE